MVYFSDQVKTASLSQLQLWKSQNKTGVVNGNTQLIDAQIAKLTANQTSTAATTFSTPSLLSTPAAQAAASAPIPDSATKGLSSGAQGLILSAGDQLALNGNQEQSSVGSDPIQVSQADSPAGTDPLDPSTSTEYQSMFPKGYLESIAPTSLFADPNTINAGKSAEQIAGQAPAASAGVYNTPNKRANLASDIGYQSSPSLLLQRVRRGINSTIAAGNSVASPLIQKPTLLG